MCERLSLRLTRVRLQPSHAGKVIRQGKRDAIADEWSSDRKIATVYNAGLLIKGKINTEGKSRLKTPLANFRVLLQYSCHTLSSDLSLRAASQANEQLVDMNDAQLINPLDYRPTLT